MTALQTKDLRDKAMLVGLNIRAWTARMADGEVQDMVANAKGNAKKAGEYRKRLTTKGALKDINSIVSTARDFHKEQTRPWTDEGMRILPSKNYLYYTNKMREFNDSFEKAVLKLIEDYAQIKTDAKEYLKGLYKDEDYPDVSEIKSKYSFKISVSPIPSANDFRVTQISDEDIAAIQKQIEDKLEEANKMMMKDLWERLHEVVLKAVEAFEDPEYKFKDSKITNIAEMVDILRRLNMEDDPKLNRMCKVVEARLCNLDPKELRKEPEARSDAAKDAKSILETISSYL